MSDPQDEVRQVIKQAGLRTPLDDEDVRDIISQGSNDTPSTLGTADINLPSSGSTGSTSSGNGRSSNAERRGQRRALRSAMRKTPQREASTGHVQADESGAGDASVDLSLPSSVLRDLQTPPRHSHSRHGGARAGHESEDQHNRAHGAWSAPTPRIDDSDTIGENSFSFGASPGLAAHRASSSTHALLQGRLQASEQQNTQLQDRIDELEDTLHAESLRITQAETRAARADAEARRALDASKAARQAAAERLSALERELDHFRTGAAEADLDAADLELSEAAAESLHARERGSLTLRERMALRLREVTRPMRGQLEATRRELDEARDTLGGQATTAERAHRESAREARTARADAEDASARATDAEERAERLRERVRSLEQRCDQLQGKGDAFDAAEAERIALQRRSDELSQAFGASEGRVQDLEDQRERLRGEIGDLRAKEETLAADRTRWQRAAEDAQRELRRERARSTELESRCAQAEAGRDQARETLQAERDEKQAAASRKLDAELQRLREESGAEIRKVRSEADELRERESRHFEGRAQEQAAAVRALQERLDASEHTRRQLSQQLDSDVRTAHEGRANAQADARVKTFELERTAASLGEAQEARRAAEERVEILRKQIDAARAQIQRVGSSTEQERAELKAGLEHERAKVRAYQALEAELDATVLAAGRAAAGLIEDGETLGSGKSQGKGRSSGAQESKSLERPADTAGADTDEALLADLPVGAQRRVRQGVRLAHLLVVRTREVHELRAQLEAARSTTQELRQAMLGMEEDITRAAEPQAYVVKALRAKEESIRKLKEEVQAARQAIAAQQARCLSLEEARDEVQRQLARVLASRTEIHDLRDAIAQAIRSSSIRPGSSRSSPLAALEGTAPASVLKSQLDQPASPAIGQRLSLDSPTEGGKGSGRVPVQNSESLKAHMQQQHIMLDSEPASPTGGSERPRRLPFGGTKARDPSPPQSESKRQNRGTMSKHSMAGGIAIFPSIMGPNDDDRHQEKDDVEVRFMRVVTDEGGAPLPPWYVKERIVSPMDQVQTPMVN